jgi:hypothetical protein
MESGPMLAATVASREALPPAPVHCRVYVIVPGEAGATVAEPLAGSGPDQSFWLELAEAEQEVAFVLDQLSVTFWPSVTLLGDADIMTVGLSGGGCGLPAPPHAFSPAHKIATHPKVPFIWRLHDTQPVHQVARHPDSRHDVGLLIR